MTSSVGVGSPILSITHGETESQTLVEKHSHPEPMLLSTRSATLTVTSGDRDWLVPPGYGLWVPGGAEHSASTLRAGEVLTVTFAPSRCPITWTEPTGLSISPLLHELITHLHRVAPRDPSRPHAEGLMFELLTPLPTYAIQAPMPTDPRVRAIAERLIANPADRRDLAIWAHEVHAGARTVSRLFRSETGLSFAQWRTQVRMRAAAHLLTNGASVNATARAVGYHKPSAFIDAFRRLTGQTPGTYVPVDTVPAEP